MHEDRAFLRALLSALLRSEPGTEGLYIPRGEAGMRRMIRALIASRPPEREGTALYDMLQRFEAMDKGTGQAADARTNKPAQEGADA